MTYVLYPLSDCEIGANPIEVENIRLAHSHRWEREGERVIKVKVKNKGRKSKKEGKKK
jgi:hypothetical protein